MKYSEIQSLRQQLIDEIILETPMLTLEHLKLVEMRLGNILLAGIKYVDVVKDAKSETGEVIKS